ncbi:Putative outer membrane protein precursor [Aquisphaera giovannonii]|uniref:Outer membrane protein n=1 Tax=Aquisphaera giovannonii TaxID=406548 RepID=A0A5B9VXA8_9BACT|nr:outer membrane protein transport protein [Aquisphaera giovannonii]QEH32749.1 Putative outer membrane protein precursor [Aquisphaera giovannonii]
MRVFAMGTAPVLAAVAMLSAGASGQGIVAPGAGPINRSMAGASTAAAVDFGSSYWNPATLSFLERDEMLLGSELIIPSIHYSAALRADSIGGVFPPENRFGTSRSDSGVPTNLAVGASWRFRPDSPLTMGLLISGVVGGNVNFAGSPAIPTLAPRQPPNTFGLGPVYANTSLLAIKPMASYQVGEQLSIAFAPVVSTGTVQFNPAFFAPGPADQYGIATFPAATNARPFWGGGFEVGLLYAVNDDWNVGFSYKSPIWQERWSYNSDNPNLSPRRIGLQADIPAIYSWGVAYKGIDRLLVDVDLRYFDYSNAALWGDSIQSGGLAWSSILAVAVGAQYNATDRLTLRGGYLFNQNPINGVNTLFNIQAPGFIQHTLSLGLSYRVTDDLQFNAGWVHGFRNSIEGPIVQVPGTAARMDAQVDSILAGLTIQYGAKRNRGPSADGQAAATQAE